MFLSVVILGRSPQRLTRWPSYIRTDTPPLLTPPHGAFPSIGHAEAILWATNHFGTDLTWAVEDNRSVTGLLERELLAAGQWPVVRCPPHLMARSRASA